MRKLFTSGVTLLVVSLLTITGAFGQATANATITVTIVRPISIAKTIDVNFGNVSVSGTAGTVILAPNGSRTTTGGVTLPSTAGTLTAASFTITGEGSYSYSITLPSSPVTISHGTDMMTINNFISSTAGTLSGGTQTFKVGATLNVAPNQAPGTYVSGTPFSVTVNYN